MTKQRYDSHSTEFGLWLRSQRALGTKLGFVATNLDYIWGNYDKKKWMLIEEKRWQAPLRHAQKQLIDLVDNCCNTDPMYQGFALLQFERTSPEDGRIYWNNTEIDRDQLLKRLAFEE